MLKVLGLCKSYGGQEVLRGATFDLGHGERAALVGRNGAGKTTLLRIVLGQESADAGSVVLPPSGRVAYLPQDAASDSPLTLDQEVRQVFAPLQALEARQREIEAAIAALPPGDPRHLTLAEEHARLHDELERRGAYTMESEIGRVLAGLGFSDEDRARPVRTFSGGWQMRVALARLLLQQPDLLLLDEPTNHLDLRAVEWLESYLRRSRSTVVVVSHDRYFLDQVAERTLELRNGVIESYPGNYSFYVVERERRRQHQEAAYRRQQEFLAEQRAFIARFRYNARRSAQARSREKQLEKLQVVERPEGDGKRLRFRFPPSPPSGREAVRLKQVSRAYGDKLVFADASLLLERGDRVAVVGPNGSGKSTLVRLLAGVDKPTRGSVVLGQGVRLAYYSQNQADLLEPDRPILDTVYSAAPPQWTLGEVRGLLGRFLFSQDEVFKQVGSLSGGERARVALARLLLRPSNLLILDEPTNHLDVPAREVLEEALKEYEGTLVLVTHDRYLIDRLATRVIEVADGQVRLYSGNYSFYRARKAAEAEGAATAPSAPARGPEPTGEAPARSPGLKARRSAPREERAAAAAARRDFAALEARIIAAEARMAELEALLAAPDTYADGARAATVVDEYTRLAAELAELNAQWAECGSRVADGAGTEGMSVAR